MTADVFVDMLALVRPKASSPKPFGTPPVRAQTIKKQTHVHRDQVHEFQKSNIHANQCARNDNKTCAARHTVPEYIQIIVSFCTHEKRIFYCRMKTRQTLQILSSQAQHARIRQHNGTSATKKMALRPSEPVSETSKTLIFH